MIFTIPLIFNHDPPDSFDNPHANAQFEFFKMRSERLGRLSLNRLRSFVSVRQEKSRKSVKKTIFPRKAKKRDFRADLSGGRIKKKPEAATTEVKLPLLPFGPGGVGLLTLYHFWNF